MEPLLNSAELSHRQAILVVDNEPFVREVLGSLLVADGHEVRSAGTPEEALRHLRIALPDLLLMDVQMPAMDGWKLLDHIRREFPPIPVVMMSDARFAQKAATYGAGFLSKPYRRDSLRRVIVDHLRARFEGGCQPVLSKTPAETESP